MNGRALAVGADVTMDSNTISGPTCAAAPVGVGGGGGQGSINVVKIVINDNGGTKTIADFPLFVGNTPVTSGETINFNSPATYNVSETVDSHYTQTFSGDCLGGSIFVANGAQKFCIITNNDIGAPVVVAPVPPLIDVVKVPNPLALPKGPGPVTYTYTVRNVGPVPMTDVTMVGDTCSPIKLISGDTNSDSKLDMTETWNYTCTTTLSETHTNTVVATGWANGISAIDIASATVIVGKPIVPPLIHVTKVPSPLALPAGGGNVTYTERITNPGTVPLSNVKLVDDKCNPMGYVYGDVNNNKKLEPTETWIYSCESNLSETTTNTAVATGEGNGFTVKDFAIATVVVAAAVPALPNTGFGPAENNVLPIALASSIFAISLLIYIIRKKENV